MTNRALAVVVAVTAVGACSADGRVAPTAMPTPVSHSETVAAVLAAAELSRLSGITASIVIACVTTFLAVRPLDAQRHPSNGNAPTRTEAVLALVDELPFPDTDAIVMRRANVTPQYVIVVERNVAHPSRLALAVAFAGAVHARYAHSPASAMITRVPKTGPTPRLGNAKDWAERLGKVRPTVVPGVGEVPSIVVDLQGH